MVTSYTAHQTDHDPDRPATAEDLYKVEQKAELVNGRLEIMDGTGGRPSLAAAAIFMSLHGYAKRTGSGTAYPDNAVFLVDLPTRQSFSPDAAYYVGPPPTMKFQQGAPIFAVEVRSESDYGVLAEREMAAKRGDYFAAGTVVVWDVDLLSQGVIRVYYATSPDGPSAIYRRGEEAEAGPAVPTWRFPVDELFD